MKLLRSFLLVGMFFWVHSVFAQSGPQLVPSGQVPATGTFWLVLQNGQNGYVVVPSPSLPIFNGSPYVVYYLADGTYLVDDTAETGGLTADQLNTEANLILNYIGQAVAAAQAKAAAASPMAQMTMMASSLSSAYAYANPVYLTNVTAHSAGDGSITANFSIAGGTNFAPYDILTTTNLLTPVNSWSWLGIGYTSNSFTFNEQPANMAFYILAKPSKTMTVGIGDSAVGQCSVPYGLTNVIQIAAGRGQSLALKTDGTVVTWGEDINGQGSVPANLSGVARISAGYYHDVALLTNGTVVAWGFDDPALGYYLTNVPPNLTGVAVIAAGGLHTLALCTNGTVVAWGYDGGCGETDVPAGLTNVTAISAGFEFSLAVSNGLVVAWGCDTLGQCDVPAGLSNVVDVAAGPYHSLALLRNGTVAAWGDDVYGETDVPADLTNAVAIAAGGDPVDDVAYSMALRSDGTVAVWGDDDPSSPVGGLNDVIGIAAGNFHALAIRTGPPTPVITQEPIDKYEITNGTVTITSRGAGLYGVTYQWQFNGVNVSGATNSTLIVTNVQSTNDSYSVTVTDNAGMGSIVSSNVNIAFVTPPVILSQSPLPTNQTVLFETNVTLSVTAAAIGMNGGFPLSYQWQLNGANIPGANGPSNEFSATLSGTYSVIVTNAVGSTNVGWELTVINPGGLLIFNQPANQYQIAGGSVDFVCNAVSSNAVVSYRWQFDGTNIPGATNSTLTLTNVQAAQQGYYDAIVSDGANSLTSSNVYFTLVTPPAINSETLPYNQFALYGSNLTLDVSASAPGQTNGFPLAYQWQFDGTSISGQTSSNYIFRLSDPGTYSVVVTNAAGSTNISWQVNLAYPGDIVGWGSSSNGQITVPPELTNVISLAAGEAHGLVALDSGSVTNWGSYWTGSNFVPVLPPPIITNALAVAAGSRHDVALLQNGTVVAWGLNDFGQTNVSANATNVTAVAAGGQQSLALLQNATVIQWGQISAPVPAGLTNVTAIAAGTNFCLALLSNATVVAWGANNFGQTNVPVGLSNVVAIAAGGAHALALERNGTVVAWGDNTYGETNVPDGLSNVMNIAAGDNHSIALENDGTVVAWGDNTFGQTNISGGLNQIKLIAGGGYFSLAVIFSPTVVYPVNVSQDLLLIYNTNSTNSTALEEYYLAHRPMISGANVLGVACDTSEQTTSNNCDAQIVAPVLNWLADNPTKHPQYLVLFFDIPTRIYNYDPINYPCVTMRLRNSYPGTPPFITYINAGTVADCEAYVDKIANMSTNSLSQSLIVSASAGGYGNTNFALDNIRNGPNSGDADYTSYGYVVSNAIPAINAERSFGIIYSNGIEATNLTLPHITNVTNVAGYICWGAHSSLDGGYPNDGAVVWNGNSSWWVIETVESYNGERSTYQGNFIKWFSSDAFGGTNYSNTPIGAVSHVEEPTVAGIENSAAYFGLWAAGKTFAICAWESRQTPYFQAIGDPFVVR